MSSCFICYKMIGNHSKKCRTCSNKSRTSNKNPTWKGDKVRYKALHHWVRRHKPKSEVCECCDQKPTSKRGLDLANISQQYKRDINDYEWLCRKCHMTKDKRMNNLKQFKNG